MASLLIVFAFFFFFHPLPTVDRQMVGKRRCSAFQQVMPCSDDVYYVTNEFVDVRAFLFFASLLTSPCNVHLDELLH